MGSLEELKTYFADESYSHHTAQAVIEFIEDKLTISNMEKIRGKHLFQVLDDELEKVALEWHTNNIDDNPFSQGVFRVSDIEIIFRKLLEEYIEQELDKARREYFSMGMEYFSLIDDSNIYQQKGWKLPKEKAERLQILGGIFELLKGNK
jgi:hypothetical protein